MLSNSYTSLIMKTENIPPVEDPIWNNTVGLQPISNEECLPIMGNSQISSILQNLDDNNQNPPPSNIQDMNLIIISNNDYKTAQAPLADTPVNIENAYVILKDTNSKVHNVTGKISSSKNKYGEECFQNMLYFVCNLCPFLCTEDSKITEHLEEAHKNQSVANLNELKCPACPNVFFHKVSLRSHLTHDHNVCDNSDLNLIVQAVGYFSNKNKNKKPEQKSVVQEVSVRIPKESSANHEETKEVDCDAEIKQVILEPTSIINNISLPQVDLTNQTSSENIKTSLMNKSDPAAKYVSTKNCPVPSCKVRLNDISKLKYHINCHEEKAYKCLECKESFLLWKPLTSHLWRVHQIDMELFSCDKCDYKSHSLAKLNNVHRLIHSETKAFSCDICDKAFKNSKQLQNHKMIHSEKKNKQAHECKLCSKMYSDKRTLKAHMEGVHQKIKPYLCSYCGYKGSSRSTLKTHIRTHTGEKPFACEQCSYTTSDHNSLRKHKLRHSGQKPYKCSYCSYACIQSSTYKVHLKMKHPGMEKDLLFTCMYCQFRTVNKEMFGTHMVTVHKQTPEENSSK